MAYLKDINNDDVRSEGLSFPEAVERLAGEAGLELPRQRPEDREAERRRTDLYEVLDRAATWNSERTPLEQIRAAAWKLVEWRDFPARWRRERFDRDDAVDQIVASVGPYRFQSWPTRAPRDLAKSACNSSPPQNALN